MYGTEFSSAQEGTADHHQAFAPLARTELHPRQHLSLNDDCKSHLSRVGVETPRPSGDPTEKLFVQGTASLRAPDDILAKHHVLRI